MNASLQWNTNARKAVLAILNDEVFPIIDFNGRRYHFDVTEWSLGTIIWTEFDLDTKDLVDGLSYTVPYAAHNILREIVFGPRSKAAPTNPVITTFPSYSLPDENGTVIP